MRGIPLITIYFIAAVALWRLWPTDHGTLWWLLLGLTVLNWWVMATVRTAYAQALAQFSPKDDLDRVMAYEEAKQDDVVRFWNRASLWVSAMLLLVAVVALTVSFVRL